MLDVRKEGLNRFLHFAPVVSYESKNGGFGRDGRGEFRNGVQCIPYRLDSCFRRNDKVR